MNLETSPAQQARHGSGLLQVVTSELLSVVPDNASSIAHQEARDLL